MNKLTERLLAEGFTKDNHPDYVEWSNWEDFEYTRTYLNNSVWEAPCGLLKKGMDYNHGSHMGVDYCPENDNPREGCPFYDTISCAHRFPEKLCGWNCAFHQTDREYDYANSVEKLWDSRDRIQSVEWRAAMAGYGYCACMVWDAEQMCFEPKYLVDKCISADCKNETCAITKLPRNLERVNIYYDILRHWHYRKGLLEYHDRKLEKGVRKFKKAVARTDAEIWLRQNEGSVQPRQNRDDRRDGFFSEMHGETGFGEYDYFNFEATAQNVRIERRESHDLAQDLADIADGIEVVHASDQVKRLAQEKRDRKAKRLEAKARKTEKNQVKKWLAFVDDESQSEVIRDYSCRELQRRGLHSPANEDMQMSLFDEMSDIYDGFLVIQETSTSCGKAIKADAT